MSQANVEIVREVMALVDRVRNREQSLSLDDLTERLTVLVASDAQIDMSQRVLNPDVYRGQPGLRRLLEEIREVWDEFRVTPERLVDAGESVVVIESLRGRGRGSGVETRSRPASVWSVRDGQVINMATHHDPTEAFEAAGLEG
jgi:ketosteroid isomerase-like protein